MSTISSLFLSAFCSFTSPATFILQPQDQNTNLVDYSAHLVYTIMDEMIDILFNEK